MLNQKFAQGPWARRLRDLKKDLGSRPAQGQCPRAAPKANMATLAIQYSRGVPTTTAPPTTALTAQRMPNAAVITKNKHPANNNNDNDNDNNNNNNNNVISMVQSVGTDPMCKTAGVFAGPQRKIGKRQSGNSEGPGCSTRLRATMHLPTAVLRGRPVQTQGATTNVWQGVPATWHVRREVNFNQDGNRS